MGAHAHACSDGILDCLQEAHAEAIVHAGDDCAGETCIDTTIEAADGVLAKLLELDGGDLLFVVALVLLGLFVAPASAAVTRHAQPPQHAGFRLLPPARAPPLTL